MRDAPAAAERASKPRRLGDGEVADIIILLGGDASLAAGEWFQPRRWAWWREPRCGIARWPTHRTRPVGRRSCDLPSRVPALPRGWMGQAARRRRGVHRAPLGNRAPGKHRRRPVPSRPAPRPGAAGHGGCWRPVTTARRARPKRAAPWPEHRPRRARKPESPRSRPAAAPDPAGPTWDWSRRPPGNSRLRTAMPPDAALAWMRVPRQEPGAARRVSGRVATGGSSGRPNRSSTSRGCRPRT
jgi:hypothetical protein